MSIVVGMVLGVLLAEHLPIVCLDLQQGNVCAELRLDVDLIIFIRYIEWNSSLTKCFVSTTLA